MDTIKKILRFLFYVSLDIFCRFVVISYPKKTFDIVIVKLDGIGDFILVGSYINAIINKYPQKSILIITGTYTFELTSKDKNLSSFCVDIKRYVKSIRYRCESISLFRSVSANLLVVPVVSRNSTVIDSIASNVQAKQKVCIRGDYTNQSVLETLVYNCFYTQIYKPPIKCRHEMEVYNGFFEAVFGVSSKQVLPRIIGYNSQDISLNHLNLPDKYAVLAIGSSDIGKIWPLERFGQLALFLSLHVKGIVFVGNKDEAFLADIIAKQNQKKIISINLCGCVDLQSTCKVLEGANIVIGNDSAVIHMAATLGKQSVVIAGGGHWGRFLPYPEDCKLCNPVVVTNKMNCFNCNWNCTKRDLNHGPYNCIDSVKTVDVIDAALPFLT